MNACPSSGGIATAEVKAYHVARVIVDDDSVGGGVVVAPEVYATFNGVDRPAVLVEGNGEQYETSMMILPSV